MRRVSRCLRTWLHAAAPTGAERRALAAPRPQLTMAGLFGRLARGCSCPARSARVWLARAVSATLDSVRSHEGGQLSLAIAFTLQAHVDFAARLHGGRATSNQVDGHLVADGGDVDVNTLPCTCRRRCDHRRQRTACNGTLGLLGNLHFFLTCKRMDVNPSTAQCPCPQRQDNNAGMVHPSIRRRATRGDLRSRFHRTTPITSWRGNGRGSCDDGNSQSAPSAEESGGVKADKALQLGIGIAYCVPLITLRMARRSALAPAGPARVWSLPVATARLVLSRSLEGGQLSLFVRPRGPASCSQAREGLDGAGGCVKPRRGGVDRCLFRADRCRPDRGFADSMRPASRGSRPWLQAAAPTGAERVARSADSAALDSRVSSGLAKRGRWEVAMSAMRC